MQVGRYSPSSAVVGGKIYVIGGCATRADHPCDQLVAAVEAYDPATARWTLKAPMPTPRFGLRSEAFDGVIYAIGGSAAQSQRTVEVYDPSTNAWRDGPDLPAPQMFFGSAIVQDKLYIIGTEVYEYTP